MLDVFLFGLREAFHRRIVIVLLALGLVITSGMIYALQFSTLPDGTVMVTTFGGMSTNATQAIPQIFGGLASFASTVYMFVTLFAVAPLMTSFLETGWAEMIVSKSVPRWKIVVAHYLSTVAIVTSALLLLPGLIGFYFWLRSGIPPFLHLLGGLALLIFSFSSVLALMSLVAMIQKSPVVPIMVGYLIIAMSAMLHGRQNLYGLITQEWIRTIFDWTYYIMPKTSELNNAAIKFFQTGEMAEWWWPIWTTALFLLAMQGIAVLLFRQKSF